MAGVTSPAILQGYLAHKKTPTPLGPPYEGGGEHFAGTGGLAISPKLILARETRQMSRTSMGGVPREQKMLKGHLPRVISLSIILRETRQMSSIFPGNPGEKGASTGVPPS